MMQTCADFNHIDVEPIVDRVGKAVKKDPPKIAMSDRPHFRRLDQAIERAPELLLELRAKPSALPLVPA